MKLATKLILLIVGLAVIVVGLTGYIIYSQGEQRWKEDLDNRLTNAAQAIAEAVDQEALQQIKKPQDVSSEAYQTAKKPLHDMLVSSSLDWAGIYYLENNNFYYWLDDSDSGVGYPFFYATAEHFAAYTDQQPHPVKYEDEFGSYYGFVAPILKKDSDPPQTLGLVEVVIARDSADLLQASTLARLVGIILAAILIFALVAIFSIHFTVSKPLEKLRRGALELASGNLDADVTIKSRDELYTLSMAFRELVNYMQSLAEAADQIRQGDLSRQIQPRSEKDILGQAFVRMADYLSRMATAASQIAEGNLMTKFHFQSEKDILGKAFFEMTENLKTMVEGIIHSTNSLLHKSSDFLDTTQKVGNSLEQISTSIQQVAQNTSQQAVAIEGIARGADEQKHSTTNASQTSEQMSHAIQQVVQNSQIGIARANTAAQAARAGAQKVQVVITEMGRIKEKVGETATAVAGMKRHSDQIQNIAETIDEFSSQTNLLALNAAIEAARAGEHGRGFAVVAGEVRKLAERVSISTQEIRAVVIALRQSIQEAGNSMAQGSAEVENGVARVSEAGQALEQILESITEVVQQAEGISTAAKGISDMSLELLRGMNAVSDISQENSAATSQMAANSAQVSVAAETVNRAVQDMSKRVYDLINSAKTLADMANELQTTTVKFKL